MLFPIQHVEACDRVVVTGLGIATAHGTGWRTNAEGFRAGSPCFGPVTLFDASRQRVKTAAQVDLPASIPVGQLSARKSRRLDRAGRLLLLAAAEALAQAAWPPGLDTALVLGTTSGGMARGEEFLRCASACPPQRRGQAERVTHYVAQRQGMALAEAYGLRGPMTIIANACAAGANAVGHGFDLIRAGRATRALCGGYDALSHLVFAGFDSLQALSPTTCRPFDARRDGLALGEGAALLALEPMERAHARGATILGEIAGYGTATDAHHLTQPHPQGEAAFTTMRAACAAAGIEPAQVGYLNAHGTGTVLNDSAEMAAIQRWAGPSAATLHVSSTKASIGHLLGAAGAVESAVCLMSLREGWLPPNLASDQPDPAVGFRLISQPMTAAALGRPYEFALSNSFGFGGANASLLFRRWP